MYGLKRGYTSYTSNYGLLELREEIAQLIQRRHDITYNPRDQVLVTVGVSEALDLAMRALLAPGDEVLIPEPCYVSYKACVHLAGGKPVPVATSAAQEFKVRAADLEALLTPRTKVLMMGFPNNPTGAIMNREDLLELALFAEKHDLIVISDEIYGDLTYEGEHVSFASLPGMQERTILLNGFSKAYAMAGARVGYAIGPAELIAGFDRIRNHFGINRIGQAGALAALQDRDWLAHILSQVAHARSRIATIARDNGLTPLPSATNFIAIDCGRDGAYARRILAALSDQGIFARMPGVAPMDRCIRVSCGPEPELAALAEALPRAIKAAA